MQKPSAAFPVNKLFSSNIYRVKSYGEYSETPSSLLGCKFYCTRENLLHSVAKKCDIGEESNTRQTKATANAKMGSGESGFVVDLSSEDLNCVDKIVEVR